MDRIQKALEAIVIYPGEVGILLSGGADSALLLYFLLSKYKDKIHIFTTAIGTDEQHDVKASIDVINKCVDLTGNRNVEQHISFTERGDPRVKKTWDLPQLYLDNKTILKVFGGPTCNPPQEVQQTWPEEIQNQVDVSRNNESLDPFSMTCLTRPWITLNKRDIATLYNRYNLMDSLFPLTKSCIDRQATSSRFHCGDCWWCKEREWGFGRLQ